MCEQFGSKWAFQYDEDGWIIKPINPLFNMKCRMAGLNPNDYPNGISQSELYHLRELK